MMHILVCMSAFLREMATMARARTMDKEIEISSLPLTTAGRARGGRATQQDELICLHDAGTGVRLLVLADGMGGDGAGELAAQGVIHVTRLLWQQRHPASRLGRRVRSPGIP